MDTLVVVEKLTDWPAVKFDHMELVSAQDYLSNQVYHTAKPIKILNLCRSYAYQRLGYYVSLVATARGHKPQPSLLCIEDLKSTSFIRIVSKEMDEITQKALKDCEEEESISFNIYFGQTVDPKFGKIGALLCKQFPAPILQARFGISKEKWSLANISPLAINQIPADEKKFFLRQAENHLNSGTVLRRAPIKTSRYDLAILVNPEDPTPPSNPKAIQYFVKAAEKLGFGTEIIAPGDFSRIPEFDALFIRETTAVNHHSFRFARCAAAHGMVVIDDPNSILRCSNKIFLAELMQKHKLPTPSTTIIGPDSLKKLDSLPEFPFVLKQPDGSFSRGVILMKDAKDFADRSPEFFKSSDLLIAQEFMPSEFDWRIGVLDGKALYACKYFMVKNHWQIYRSRSGGKKPMEGNSEGIPLTKVPAKAKQLAEKVSSLIGDGLYGIDIKELNGQFYVIEVNDNPSIDAGNEDQVLGEHMYLNIMNDIKRRVESLERTV
jgi:glutathione synthase/RimK-type ligase-like ATP-grasp enzyme